MLTDAVCAILPVVRRASATLVFLIITFASRATADDVLQWSGFALLRASTGVESGPLEEEVLSAQAHVGLDWTPSPFFGAHVHLLARDDADGARRGNVGIAEAYVEGNLRPGGDRLRLRAGAMFLPTSRENVDALWETAYTINPSALNSWLGEELRPIGIDAAYTHRGFTAGATLFRGNDTFGALPPVRGWSLRDHWATLGEWIPVDPEYVTSVSAESDGRLGWSARGAWNGQNLFVQLTHIDNRADGLEYHRLFNWGTRFEIVSAEYTKDNWTVAAEYGWGPTFLVVEGDRFYSDLRAGYVLASHFWPDAGSATVRLDAFGVDDSNDLALTVAYLLNMPGRLRPGIEWTTTGSEHRWIVEMRYSFSGN